MTRPRDLNAKTPNEAVIAACSRTCYEHQRMRTCIPSLLPAPLSVNQTPKTSPPPGPVSQAQPDIIAVAAVVIRCPGPKHPPRSPLRTQAPTHPVSPRPFPASFHLYISHLRAPPARVIPRRMSSLFLLHHPRVTPFPLRWT
jgi:hypothetical protein